MFQVAIDATVVELALEAQQNLGFLDQDPPRGHPKGQTSAALAPSSSQAGGDVHERVFAEFEDNWLSHALITNLAMVT
jgi:hypothetical protein